MDENLEEFNETEVISTNDVIIETNAPPKIQQFDVTPREGEAFLTNFVFKTSKAEDKDGDPILYKFGYVLGNRDVMLWSLSGVTTCEANLPFSGNNTKLFFFPEIFFLDDGIQTFVEACDNFNSCERLLGPLITTKLPENTDNT